jgi:hypothetical protein
MVLWMRPNSDYKPSQDFRFHLIVAGLGMPSRSNSLSHFVRTGILALALQLAIAPADSSAQQPSGGRPSPESMAAAIEKAKNTYLPTDPATVIAVVGTSQILLGDVKAKVDVELNKVLAKTTQEVPEEILKTARINFTRGLLQRVIEGKRKREMFLLEQVGTQGADKRREAAEMMSSRARQMFYETEVAELKKKHSVSTLPELDKLLREQGSSLKGRERDFMDAMLGHMFIRGNIEKDPHVTLSEINSYYAINREEFSHPARASWEQFTVLFSNHETREAAQTKIWEMGREAYFGGNLQAVAKQKSEEPFAADGGLHDWTTQGSLASKTLDQQIFSLPLNEMSDIIEDDNGFHIVRVLKREMAGVKTLGAVQEDIKKKLKAEKVQKSVAVMIKRMEEQVPVWTIFPEDIPGASALNVPQIATMPNAQNY